MDKLFLLPVEDVLGDRTVRGPMYVGGWRGNPPNPTDIIVSRSNAIDYGFVAYMLVALFGMTQEQYDWLVQQPGVYAFHDNLDNPVANDGLDIFLEDLHFPTDWLTPSTSYRELLRNLFWVFQFNVKFGAIFSDTFGGLHSVFDNLGLDDTYADFTVEEKTVFDATVAAFGYDPSTILPNQKLRQLLKTAATEFAKRSFPLGTWNI